MKSTYLDTPNAAIALNFKVGSSSLSRAVIAAHHPAVETMIHTPPGTGRGVAYPAGKSADGTRFQGLCPKVEPSERPVTLLAVRDPVEKFRSACVESKVSDVDAKLTELETDGFARDVHFWAQSRLLEGNAIKLYRFPSDLDALATEAGLSLPLPDIDGGNDSATKPTLTSKQLERVKAIYADDIALYESITEVGQAFAPPALTPAPISVPHSITAWQAKAGLALTSHPQAGTMLVAAEAALAAMPEGAEKIVVLSAWNNNANFERTSPTILSFGAALGMTSDDLDNLFRVGGSLTV